MKSNICKIEKGTRDLDAILKESERVAEYNGLTHKETLQLRLLCEEIDGMLPNIIDDFDGSRWIEFENGVCKINVSIEIPELNIEKKEKLIDVAKNKKNAAAVGIVGKIRNAIENFFLDEAAVFNAGAPTPFLEMSTGYSDGVDYSYLWSLEQYRGTVREDKESAEWDELEKCVIASASDDVIVGVKGKCAEIVVIKRFS